MLQCLVHVTSTFTWRGFTECARGMTVHQNIRVGTNTTFTLQQRIHTGNRSKSLPTTRRVNRKLRLAAFLTQHKQALLAHIIPLNANLNCDRCTFHANCGMHWKMAIRIHHMSENLLICDLRGGFQGREMRTIILKEEPSQYIFGLLFIWNNNPYLSLLPLTIFTWQRAAYFHPHRILLLLSFKYEIF